MPPLRFLQGQNGSGPSHRRPLHLAVAGPLPRAAPPQHCQCVSRYLREAHDRTTRCCAPVPSALAMLAFSCQFPVPSGRLRRRTARKMETTRICARAQRAGKYTEHTEKRCQCVYREDAKGGAAKSVRDRFTAPLRSGRIKSHRRTSHVSYVSHVSLTLRRHTMPGGFLR